MPKLKMTSAQRKRFLLFLPAVILGLLILTGRHHFEKIFGMSLAEADLHIGFARLTDTERDIDETRAITDEIAAEAGGLDPEWLKKTSSPPPQPATLAALRALRSKIKQWAPRCDDGILTYHTCPYPEALRHLGLLCLSGDFASCEQVREARDDQGRFWRSKSFIGVESQGKPSFSSSSARGVLAYLVAKADLKTAADWIAYIRKTDSRFCPDVRDPENQCRIRAYFWHLAWQLNEHYHFLQEDQSLRYLGYLMVRNEDDRKVGQEKGYDLLGTAETIYLLREMKKRGIQIADSDLIDAVSIVLHYRHPDQPLLRFLVRGPDEETARLLLARCPATKPFPKVEDGWPKYDVEISPKSAGHDCIFLINLLLGSAK
jgi:hypothetical protein